MKLLLLILSFALSLSTIAQVKELKFKKNLELDFSDSPIMIQSNKLVSSYSFDKLVFEDLSHLLLGGGTAPSEGIEATFDEDKSKISLSGILIESKYGFLTVKGEFSATDKGIYFIDENNGSKSAKIALNYYLPFGGSRYYDDPITSKKAARAFYTIEKAKQNFIGTLIRDYYYTRYLLNAAGIPNEDDSTDLLNFYNSLEDLKYTVDHTKINQDLLSTSAAYIKEKKLEGNSKDEAIKVVITKTIKENKRRKIKASKMSRNVPEKDASFFIDPDIDIDKVIDLYEKTVASMDSISTKIVKKENELAQPYWNSKKLWYVGASPFYEREKLSNIFTPNETLSFDKNFMDENKDLYGIEGQFGYFYQAKGAVKKNWFTKMLFARITTMIGKGTNSKEFKKQTYNFPATTVSSIGTENITTPNKKEGNFNKENNSYNTANSFLTAAELYWFPLERFGILGQIGYDNLNFDDGDGEDVDIFNLRLGILINIKSKKKNFATLQLFADRSDLSKSPNSTDEDLRFGFKVGLPFYFRNKL